MTQLLKSPEGFFNHIKRYTASVATSITYGVRGATYDSFWANVSLSTQDKNGQLVHSAQLTSDRVSTM